MSATLPLPPTPSERLDPFRFGWRLVKQVGPDGQEHFEEVPLTLEDALHPREEDHYMVSDSHTSDCRYLAGAFETQLANTPGAVVLVDMRIAWDADGEYAHGPDVSVAFDVMERKDWATFNVVEEGTRPTLIVEITSPSTRKNDVVRKVQEYAEVGVPRYIIVDADEGNGIRTISFIHYQLSAGHTEYEQVPVSANGRVWLPEVRLWLGCEDERVACYDTRGQRLGDYTEVSQARKAAEQRAELTDERIKAAEQAITTEVEARMADNRARREAERLAAERATLIEQLQAELQRLKSERS